MADISAEIAAFKNAVYGEDVRDAMVSLANKLNTESTRITTITEQAMAYINATMNNELKQFHDKTFSFTKNLYDPDSNILESYLNSDGSIITDNRYSVTTNILVKPGQTINSAGLVNGSWQRNSTIRTYAVYKPDNTLITYNDSIPTNYTYTNNTDSDVYIRYVVFTNHPSITVTKLMIYYYINYLPAESDYVPFETKISTNILSDDIINDLYSPIYSSVLQKATNYYDENKNPQSHYIYSANRNVDFLMFDATQRYTSTHKVLVPPNKYVCFQATISDSLYVYDTTNRRVVKAARGYAIWTLDGTYLLNDESTDTRYYNDTGQYVWIRYLLYDNATQGYTINGAIYLSDTEFSSSALPYIPYKEKANYATYIDSDMINIPHFSFTWTITEYQEAAWISKFHTILLTEYGLNVGDIIYFTIDSCDGVIGSWVASLEFYNYDSQRILQKAIMLSDSVYETSAVIPEGTITIYLMFRAVSGNSIDAGTYTSNWHGIHVYVGEKTSGKKILSGYTLPDIDLTKMKRHQLWSDGVFQNMYSKIESVFNIIGSRKKFLMLAWFSDLHWKPYTGNSASEAIAYEDDAFWDTIEALKYINDVLPIMATLDTGDIINGSQPNFSMTAAQNFKILSEYFRRMYNASNMYLYSPGNHDGYNANSVSLTDTEYAIGSHILNGKISTKPAGKCYYYIDYPDINTRLLVLAIPGGGSQLGMDATQLNWLITYGFGTVPNNYGVVMAYHISTVWISYLEGGSGGFGNRIAFEGICNAFHNHTTYSDGTFSCDFSNKTGVKLVGALTGHAHFDAISNPGETFTQDQGREGTAKEGESLTNNLPCKQIIIRSARQYAFDILTYVPEDNKIYTIRIGTGNDREIDVN